MSNIIQMREEMIKYCISFDRKIRMENNDKKSPDEISQIIRTIRDICYRYPEICVINFCNYSEEERVDQRRHLYYEYELFKEKDSDRFDHCNYKPRTFLF
jgi:hypothetical protein